MATKAYAFARNLFYVFVFSVFSAIIFQILVSYTSNWKHLNWSLELYSFRNYALWKIGAPTDFTDLPLLPENQDQDAKKNFVQVNKDANANLLNQLIFYLWPGTVSPENATLLFGTSIQVYNGDFFPHLVNFSSDSIPVDAVTPFAPSDLNCTSVSYSGYGCVLLPSRLVFLRSSSLGKYSFSSVRLNATSSSTPTAIATASYVLVDHVLS